MDSEPSSTQTGAHDISDDPPSSVMRLKWDPRVSNGEASAKAGANGIQTEIYLVKILFRRVINDEVRRMGHYRVRKALLFDKEADSSTLKVGLKQGQIKKIKTLW